MQKQTPIEYILDNMDFTNNEHILKNADKLKQQEKDFWRKKFKNSNIMTEYNNIVEVAKTVSQERGYTMYIIFDSFDNSYGFTQERDLFLYDTQSFIAEVDGNEVISYRVYQ